MKVIQARAPTRVDLAGGTLDLWPLYLFHKNSVTTNLAINIYTHATIIPRRDKKIILKSADTGVEATYPNLAALENDGRTDLMLLKVHAEYWRPKNGFELITKSESPVGGGIAGSSSLNIALCGAFKKLTGRKISNEEMIRLAGNLEARVINSPTGCQDYFPPIFGGLNFIEFSENGPVRKKAMMSLKKIAERLTLVYTGRPHHSGLNNWQIFKSHIEGDTKTFENLESIRDIGLAMRNACIRKDLRNLGRVFRAEYEARLALSLVFSSPEIERLKVLGFKYGAEAIKICGAGGGGCVFLWSEANKKSILEEECRRAGFQVLQAQPVGKGLEVRTGLKPIDF